MTPRELDLLREIAELKGVLAAALDEKKGRRLRSRSSRNSWNSADDAAQAEVRFPVVHASEPRHNKFVMLV